MIEKSKINNSHPQSLFSKNVNASANRRLSATQNAHKSVWFGLGMMGLIGWSIVVPTLLGAALGIWLDKNYEMHTSAGFKINWTVALLMAGLSIGCFNAWNWVTKEDKAMHEKSEDDQEFGSGSNLNNNDSATANDHINDHESDHDNTYRDEYNDGK